MTDGEYGQLIAFLTERFDVIDRRFEAQEQRATEFRHEVLGHLDALYGRLDRVAMLQGRIAEIEHGLSPPTR